MIYVMQLVTAFIGSWGFAMLFHVQRKRLLLASLGGLLAWGAYLLMGFVSSQDVVRYFFASVALTVYAETMARVVKCPATLFLVTASIPLVPGGSLYKTMQFFMQNNLDAFASQALTTVLLAVSIAVGMLFPTSVFQLLQRVRTPERRT
ncbi:MAG: threonine/serine exporter family protein [Oscillospiraceae bacterium]|nr:threonine/serine exporter family protein [Oscillospiraceae bacterium]